MTTAIHYTSVRRPPQAGQVYGLQVAVLDWLAAYMRYTRQQTLSFLVDKEESAQEIRDIAASCDVAFDRLKLLDSRFVHNLAAFDHVFRADTDPHDLFWQRNRLGAGQGFAFCGLAHAVAGREGADVLATYCEGPSRATDAIICPSRAIRNVVQKHFDHYADYVAAHFGGHYNCPVQLPVIPLGVDTDRIACRVSDEKRRAQRNALTIQEDDIVLLWVGRLSAAIKAHPLPMFRAAELAAQQCGKRVHLVMQGYFVPETAAQDFAALARDVCQQACVHFVAADDARFPDGLWAAGDIFLSLIDNMQESFGLTPIEAIAAGLPRVLSDWDGYRDGVDDGVDGFLIPTRQPPAGAGEAFAELLLGPRETYGGYLGQLAQCVAVDQEAAAKALLLLIGAPALRRQIAEKAKERLCAYSWASIIPSYESLWAELAAQRKPAQPLALVHPRAPEPFAVYESFPSQSLSEKDTFVLAMKAPEIQKILQHNINTLAAGMMVPKETLLSLLNLLSGKEGLNFAALHQALPGVESARLWCTVAWLLKLGVLRLR